MNPEMPRSTEPIEIATTALADATLRTQQDIAFKNFGVVETGKQDRKSLPVALLIFCSVLGASLMIHTTIKKKQDAQKVITFNNVKPVAKPPEPPKPVPVLPKPPVVKVTPPEPLIKPPVIEVPEPPKIQPPVMKADPVPVSTPTPPAPKAVTPPPAPKPVAIQIAQAASVPNNSAHPSAVRLGSMSNPINNTSGPAVSPINLGRSGAPGMNAANSGLGNPSKIAISGSGSPNGSDMAGHSNAAQPIKGFNNGVAGGTNLSINHPAGAIQIATATQPKLVNTQVVQPVAAPKSAPKVLFKPRPEYTEEAKSAHVEGSVAVRIHVNASGAVQVIGVSSSLGHGLDQAAVRAAQNMRFQPAMQDGKPVEWDGVVNINFQLAS